MLFGQVAEAGEIEASRASIIKRGRLADHILRAACDAGTHNVFAKIVADVAAGVGQAVGMLSRLGQQEQASGLQRGSCDDDDLRMDGVVLQGLVIDEMYAACFASLRIDSDFTDYGIGARSQIYSVHRGIDQAGRRVEGSVNIATALALASAPAVTAAAVLIVLEPIGGYPGAILGEDAAHFGEAVF